MADDVNPYASPQTICAGTANLLPAALAAEIDRMLEPGERLIWQARPQFSAARFLKTTLVIAAQLLALVALFALVGAKPIIMGVLLLSLAGTLVLFSAAIPAFFAVRHTVYALSDRRLLICEGFFRPRTQVFLPEDIAWKSGQAGAMARHVAPPAPPWSLLGGIGDRVGVRELIANTLLSELARRLRHADPAIRRRAAARIARIGPAAAWFTSPLLAAARDDDAIVRRHAVVALGRARAASARAELARLQGDKNRGVARAATTALDKLPL